jgi:hypothetical protein
MLLNTTRLLLLAILATVCLTGCSEDLRGSSAEVALLTDLKAIEEELQLSAPVDTKKVWKRETLLLSLTYDRKHSAVAVPNIENVATRLGYRFASRDAENGRAETLTYCKLTQPQGHASFGITASNLSLQLGVAQRPLITQCRDLPEDRSSKRPSEPTR